MKCHYCEETEELRPYGPDGAPVCFDCMNASPEREEEAGRQFKRAMDAMGRFAALTDAGLRPLTERELMELEIAGACVCGTPDDIHLPGCPAS